MKNIKYTVSHPVFVFMQEHFCPYCKAELTVETAHHLVNSRSEDAKNYDFSMGGRKNAWYSGLPQSVFCLFQMPCRVFGERIVGN